MSPHPPIYDDHSPYLPELRAICLAFPEAVEVEAWGRPTFRAGKKMFAIFDRAEGHPHAVTFKADPAERPALVADERFYVPPYFGPSGWMALDLGAAACNWTEVTELIDSSYRQVALKRMLAALDAQG